MFEDENEDEDEGGGLLRMRRLMCGDEKCGGGRNSKQLLYKTAGGRCLWGEA